MNFFRTSDGKFIINIDKIQYIDKNENYSTVFLNGISQYYIITEDDSNELENLLKNYIIPIFDNSELTEEPTEETTESTTEVNYCGATDGFVNQVSYTLIYPNFGYSIDPNSTWKIQSTTGTTIKDVLSVTNISSLSIHFLSNSLLNVVYKNVSTNFNNIQKILLVSGTEYKLISSNPNQELILDYNDLFRRNDETTYEPSTE